MDENDCFQVCWISCGCGKKICSASASVVVTGGLLWHLFICSCKDFLCLYLDSQSVQANSEIPR